MRPLANPLILLRCALGGVLMGLANLVPGISGGTMLLATGVYRRFVDSVARITTFRWTAEAVAVLAVIVSAAGCAIVFGAGLIHDLVHDHRWVMYSLFLGLTLGGVPLLWRLVRPISSAGLFGLAGGLVAMVALATIQWSGVAGASGGGWVMHLVAGLAAGAAMVLPGLSGSYVLLILGQYLVILGAVEATRAAVQGDGGLSGPLAILIPVGIGAVIGIVGVSNAVKWLLDHQRQATLGALLGLLIGAVLGLWPFRAPRQPEPGEAIRGQVVSAEAIDRGSIDPKHWPTEVFAPSMGQVASALALVAVGFACSVGIGLLGEESVGEGSPGAPNTPQDPPSGV